MFKNTLILITGALIVYRAYVVIVVNTTRTLANYLATSLAINIERRLTAPPMEPKFGDLAKSN